LQTFGVAANLFSLMAKDWDVLQEEIKKLYHIEDKPLKEVMRLIKGRHGFHAS